MNGGTHGSVMDDDVDDDNVDTSVMSVVALGDADELAYRIANGVDVSCCPWPDTGWNPIHLAAAYNKPTCLQLLISAGVDIEDRCQYMGRTPLLHATAFGSKDCVYVLLANGADVNCCSPQGHYFFEEVCRKFSDMKLVKDVVRLGVHVSNFECEDVIKNSTGNEFKVELTKLLRAMGGYFVHDHICGVHVRKQTEPDMLKDLCSQMLRVRLLAQYGKNLLVIVPQTRLPPGIKKLLMNQIEL